ncbi:ComF family protein [Qipengyuania sp. DGS5-3]|uniref:ComF family protein n=1 Tax=Qipengyuania sp. DGS5-3 TaxID=3349632 RepID=UPI0036D239F8
MAEPPTHNGIAAATVYNDASRQLILAFKYGGRIALATMLAKLISARLPPVEDDAPLLIPVPLHRLRLWRRGFNQAALLARELAKQGSGDLLVDGLVRRKSTPPLAGFGSKRRRSILSGAIAINARRRNAVKDRRVILVDDVLTSGATSNACVAALKQAGARSVTIACFARVLSEAEPGNRP